MTLRNERVRKTMMKEISDIILKDIKDPHISGIVSITDVEISHDYSYAKVYYSVFADSIKKEETIKALSRVAPFIRHEIGKRIRLRVTPELRFFEDNSLERGVRVTELIEKISRGEV